VEENVAAVGVSLTLEERNRIAEILPTGGFGARYAAGSLPIWE
jgi:hypothetical protein